VPGQDGHLAGGGDHGGLEPAAGLDALIERPQRAGRAGGRPGCLDQDAADLRAACLADPAVHRGGVAGLADLRVQADIGHQLARIGEAGEFADCSNDRDRGDGVDAGNSHQPGHDRVGDRFNHEFLVDGSELGAVEVEVAQQRVDCRALIGRQILPR